MGVERVPADARLADPARRLARRRLRRAAHLRARGRVVRRILGRERAGPVDRVSDRNPGAPGSLSRPLDPGVAGRHRRRLLRGCARSRHRRLDRLERDRVDSGPPRWRRHRRLGVLALDLPRERPGRCDHPRADLRGHPGERPDTAPSHRSRRSRARRPRPRGRGLRPDRGATTRVDECGDPCPQ